MLLDTELMRTFVAIAETGSFTRAAERVHRTPSAVSMQVKRLEEMLERSLFHREARAVRLTLDGERLLGYGRRMLSLNDEALAQMKGPRLSGRVTLGAPDDFGMRFLPNILARFAATHPEVDVDVALAPSLTLIKRLGQTEIDLALLTMHADDQGFGAPRVVYSEPLVWIGLKGGTAHRKARLPLALAATGCTWRNMALKALDDADLPYRIAYTSEQATGQLAAVMADLAIAPLPESLVTEAFERLHGLPALDRYQIILQQVPRPSELTTALADHVHASFAAVKTAGIPTIWH